MALLPNIKHINKEDLPGSPSWVDNLISGMNSFFDGVYGALDGTLTFVDNIQAQTKELTFRTLSTYSSGDFDILKFTKSLKIKANGCDLLSIQKTQSPSFVIKNAVNVSSWRDINGEIQIWFITGLEDSTQYTVKFRVT